MSEPADELHARHIVHHAARRAFGSRPLLRVLAVTTWSAFIGACVSLMAWLALTPEAVGPLSLGRLTLIFMLLWALALVPAGSAALLSSPQPRHDDGAGP